MPRAVGDGAVALSSPARLIAAKYRLEQMLGRGGMGEVYQAVHVASGQRLALKLLRPPGTDPEQTGTHDSDDSDAVRRFEREAQAIALLASPHIVKVFDAGKDDATGDRFLAMELLQGEDIAAVMRRTGALGIEVSLAIAVQACVALSQAHAAGIIHRDIKPANLFAARRGDGAVVVKVVDFGIARVRRVDAASLGEVTQGLTRTGDMLGSPMYMSPEQARGRREIDHRADIWALGVVLYKMLCGAAPFEGGDIAVGELLVDICTRPAPPLHERAPWIPSAVAAAVERALQIDPAQRYFSAEEMGRALTALLPPGVDPFAIPEAALRSIDPSARAHVVPRVAAAVAVPVAPVAPVASVHLSTPPVAAVPTRRSFGWQSIAVPLVVSIVVIVGWTFTAEMVGSAWSASSGAAAAKHGQEQAAAAKKHAQEIYEQTQKRSFTFLVPPNAHVEIDGQPVPEDASHRITIAGTMDLPGSPVRTMRIVEPGKKDVVFTFHLEGDGLYATSPSPYESSKLPQ